MIFSRQRLTPTVINSRGWAKTDITMEQRSNINSFIIDSKLPDKPASLPNLGSSLQLKDQKGKKQDAISTFLNNEQIKIPAKTDDFQHSMKNWVSTDPSTQHLHLPDIQRLTSTITEELGKNLNCLLSLNPSRRDSLLLYLYRLADLPIPSFQKTNKSDVLAKWIEGPRNQSQNTAISAYLEEVALICITQILLLKSWSDRGIRPWSDQYLKNPNWALSDALKSSVPLNREGWQITCQNLYSWYQPSTTVQKILKEIISEWNTSGEGPELLPTILSIGRKSHPVSADTNSYDTRFFSTLWNKMHLFGLDTGHARKQGPIQKPWVAFSPTIRSGSLIQASPRDINFIGLENAPFLLMKAELSQLWWGPSSPPLWAAGTGLEVHRQEQITLSLSSCKPTLRNRIAQMEDCDIAFVLEEKSINSTGKSPDSVFFKMQLNDLPYFKHLHSESTTLGDLQACVSLSKLRPGGLLWWAREERLTSNDGIHSLRFLLEHGKLLCHWDLSCMGHSLPSSNPLFPKHLYLFKRSLNLEKRLNNRPRLLTIQGQLRSHVEVPLLLEDAIDSYASACPSRGKWTVHNHTSTSTQQEWTEKWPDPTAQATLEKFEKMRSSSKPLGEITNIIEFDNGDCRSRKNSKEIFIRVQHQKDNSRLFAWSGTTIQDESKHSGKFFDFLIVVPEEQWTAPLSAYLNSGLINEWLSFHVDKKRGLWNLKKQNLKYLPVPVALLEAINSQTEPDELAHMFNDIDCHPKRVVQILENLPLDTPEAQKTRAGAFSKASYIFEKLLKTQNQLFSVVDAEGRIKWGVMLKILPAKELIPFPLHPSIQITGSLPLHLPIHQIRKVQVPKPGILLVAESGFNTHISSDSPELLEILFEQIECLSHPTWEELVQFIQLPRDLNLARVTASDILHSHGEQTQLRQELVELLEACLKY